MKKLVMGVLLINLLAACATQKPVEPVFNCALPAGDTYGVTPSIRHDCLVSGVGTEHFVSAQPVGFRIHA